MTREKKQWQRDRERQETTGYRCANCDHMDGNHDPEDDPESVGCLRREHSFTQQFPTVQFCKCGTFIRGRLAVRLCGEPR